MARLHPLRRFSGALLMLVGSGCYAYTPLTTRPVPGTIASFTLTDRGRVSLGPSIGEAARSLEAVVDSASDTGYVLRMRSVTYLDGQTHNWTDERVVVAASDVTNIRERRYSQKRTIGTVVASVGGVVAFIVTRSLLGGGTTSGSDGNGGPPTEQ